MSIEEVREERRLRSEKRAQGWTNAEIDMGKGWQEKYPNLANWRGPYSLGGCDGGDWNITLYAVCMSPLGNWHAIHYVLAKRTVALSSQELVYQALDEVIQDWKDENKENHKMNAILESRRGLFGEPDWELLYPYIAGWIKQGKRHCITININCVTHKSDVKAWYYDKPSRSETVLFEQKMEGLTESEILRVLDEGIQSWMKREGRQTLDYPS